mgnify:FL=1|tara:strand:- start:362 stop:733 length:372 start_codon:yes stop_codon:yes gene_type:complete
MRNFILYHIYKMKEITIHINLPLSALLDKNRVKPPLCRCDEWEDEVFICKACLGFGFKDEEECERCDGMGLEIEELEEEGFEDSEEDDPTWKPAIDEETESEESEESDESDCGSTCNDKVCFC